MLPESLYYHPKVISEVRSLDNVRVSLQWGPSCLHDPAKNYQRVSLYAYCFEIKEGIIIKFKGQV